MSYTSADPEGIIAAAPSFKSYVVGDLNTSLNTLSNALESSLWSVSILGPFASEVEEIIAGIQGLLECLDNALNRTYIGLQNAGHQYQGTDLQLANTFNQIDASLGTFLGYTAPPGAPNPLLQMGGMAAISFLSVGEVALDIGSADFAAVLTPEEAALDAEIMAGTTASDEAEGAALDGLLGNSEDFAQWEKELEAGQYAGANAGS